MEIGEEVLHEYGGLFEGKAKEFAVLAGLSGDQAESTLRGLFEEKKLKQFSTKNGVIWKKMD